MSKFLKGAKNTIDSKAPDITFSNLNGVGSWTKKDINWLLKTSILPNGDTIDGNMLEVVEYSTSLMSNEDRMAIANYLLSIK